jgi:PKD repeat protein
MKRRLRISAVLTLLLLTFTVGFSLAQTADFTMSPAAGCAPLVVNFTDNSTGTVSSYNWNLGNSITSPLRNPSTTYAAPGT